MESPHRLHWLPSSRILEMENTTWLVYERPAAYDRRQADLVFESDLVIRCVRTYPMNWRQLSDEDLWALSWTR